MTFEDRYHSAVRASNLRSDPKTERSAADVIAAAGIAGKTAPLGMALMRLLSGDNHASAEIVRICTRMLVGKAWHMEHLQLAELDARDIAQAVLGWSRDGACKVCGGHGFRLVPGTPSLSDQPCLHCVGGKVPFDSQFPIDWLWLARWLLAEIERETSKAAPAAMAALAQKMEL